MCALPADHESDVISFGGFVSDNVEGEAREASNGDWFRETNSFLTFCCTEAYTLNITQDCWKKVKCSNTAPQQRVFGQCAIVGRKMWVVGGCDPCSDAPLGDCWTLDIDAWTWLCFYIPITVTHDLLVLRQGESCTQGSGHCQCFPVSGMFECHSFYLLVF